MEIVLLRLDQILKEHKLLRCLRIGRLFEQDPFQNCLEYRVRVNRDRHGETECGPNAVVPTEQDVEHQSINRVVTPVHRGNYNGWPRLTIPVYPAFTLLVPSGIPREVVVHDRIEPVLEIDAFGQAIGGDEDAAALFRKRFHPLLPLVGREPSGDRLDGNLAKLSLVGGAAELLSECICNVISGCNVPAEDDRDFARLLGGPERPRFPVPALGPIQ